MELHQTLKQDYLVKNVFYGLTNLNDGFDTSTIYYFSEADFRIVLDRVEELGIGLYGIEPWKNKWLFDVSGYEDYSNNPTDPDWYRVAFAEFVSLKEELCYSATYYVPLIDVNEMGNA